MPVRRAAVLAAPTLLLMSLMPGIWSVGLAVFLFGGFVGGMDVPLIHKFECGYVQGVKASSPDAKVLINYTGTTPTAWNDPVKGGELVKAQISQGSDVVYAAAGGQLGIVKQLLALDIDVNARYANDLTLLMWAAGPDEAVAEAQALEVVSYLLDAGARVDERDARGRTALMIAAEGNHPAIAKALLAHGADAALADKAGKHAADLTILSALRAELTPR